MGAIGRGQFWGVGVGGRRESEQRDRARPRFDPDRPPTDHRNPYQPPQKQQRHQHPQGGSKRDVDDVMREANELLLALSGASAGGAAPAASSSPDVLASIDELNELGYECDESGCVLVLPGMRRGGQAAANADGSPLSSWDDAPGAPPRLQRLLSGDDWKLGPLTSTPAASPSSGTTPEFSAVVTGPAWSFLLTRSELASFLEVLQRLRSVVANLDGEGQWNAQEGGRPASRVKWAAGRFSCVATHADAPNGGGAAAADGKKQQPHFSLDVSLLTPDSRLVQGSWPAHVVAAACAALDKEGLAAPEAGQRAAGLAPTAAMA